MAFFSLIFWVFLKRAGYIVRIATDENGERGREMDRMARKKSGRIGRFAPPFLA
jgi:hypothetical protein